MCEYCEGYEYMMPRCCDVPDMDVWGIIEGWVSADGKRHGTDLYLFNQRTNAEAYFKINFCPMCGRKLAERGK